MSIFEFAACIDRGLSLGGLRIGAVGAAVYVRFSAAEAAHAPSLGGGEDEHSLQIPRHGHEAPLAAHFIEPAQ